MLRNFQLSRRHPGSNPGILLIQREGPWGYWEISPAHNRPGLPLEPGNYDDGYHYFEVR